MVHWRLGFSSDIRDMTQFPNRSASCHVLVPTVPPSLQLPLQKAVSFLKVLCLIYLSCLDVSVEPEHHIWL